MPLLWWLALGQAKAADRFGKVNMERKDINIIYAALTKHSPDPVSYKIAQWILNHCYGKINPVTAIVFAHQPEIKKPTALLLDICKRPSYYLEYLEQIAPGKATWASFLDTAYPIERPRGSRQVDTVGNVLRKLSDQGKMREGK